MDTIKISGTIQGGPFDGLKVPASELYEMYNDGVPQIDKDGKIAMYWDLAARTQHFLSVFKPTDGWCVRIKAERVDVWLTDKRTHVIDEQGREVYAQQPTVNFTAALINPAGQVVATASALAMINGLSAWEKGEGKARSRLCSALGLTIPSARDDDELRPSDKQTDAPSKGDGVASVTPLNLDDSDPSKGSESQVETATKGKADEATSEDAEAKAETPEPQKGKSKKAKTKKAEVEDVKEPDKATKTAEAEPKSNEGATPSSDINKNLLRQAQHRAKLQRVDVPEFANNGELQVFMQGLLKNSSSKNASNGAGSPS